MPPFSITSPNLGAIFAPMNSADMGYLLPLTICVYLHSRLNNTLWMRDILP